MNPKRFSLNSIARTLTIFWGGTALMVSLAAQSSYGGSYALILDSPPGDWVGNGHSWYYTELSASFTATRNSHNGVSISIRTDSDCWSADFTAPDMAPLTIGTYDHAVRYPFEAGPFVIPFDAGLDIGGGSCSYGHGCDEVFGSFVVTELIWGIDDSLVSFHASFIQNCNGMPALHGELFFNSTAALPPPHHVTSPAIAYATEGQPFRYQITTSKPETTFSAVGLPAGVILDAATGLISGIAEEHGQFEISLTASGPNGIATAVLSLKFDPPGRSTGPFTAIRLTSEAGDPIGMGRQISAGLDDGVFGGGGGPGARSANLAFRPWSSFTTYDVSGDFHLTLDPPDGTVLTPGIYVDTNQLSGSGPQILPMLGTSFPYASVGTFNLKELSGAPNGRLEHFRVSFVQFSNGSPHPLRGWAWYKAENVITSSPFVLGKEGASFAYQIIANNEPVSYGGDDLPPGLSLDPQSGRITGIPSGSGSFYVPVNAFGPSAIASEDLWFKIRPAQSMANISTRANVGLGDNSLIGGFIVTGQENKRLLLRAIGPSLGGSGVNNALSDPVLELHDGSGVLIASNDDWKSQQAEVEATGIPPSDDRESAIVATLAPGNYTAAVTGKGGSTGSGLVEVYDISPHTNSQLANISTRSFVDLGDNALIGGFIVAFGRADAQSTILFRAIGPSLYYHGVPNCLLDPVLELRNANGTLLESNDDWRDSNQTAIRETGIAPTMDAESAILITLPAGAYTGIVRGKNNGTGVALVEAYQLDN